MKLTARDRIPIGSAMVSALSMDDPPAKLTEACRRAGLHPESGRQFVRRHPECRDWPFERIAEQILANRDQAAVAKRQVEIGRQGFKRVRYE